MNNESKFEKYDFKRFSKKDCLMYQQVLENTPYDPLLQEAFAMFSHKIDAQNRQDRRHVIKGIFESISTSPIANHSTPEDIFFHNVRNKELYYAISLLSKKERDRIILHFFYGYTLSEIARHAGVSHVAIHKSIKSGLKKLRLFLDEGYYL